MNSIASKLHLVALPLFFTLAACSGASSNEEVSASSEASSLTDGSTRVVFVQSDDGDTGYALSAMNCGGTRHVDALDLTATGVDLRALAASLRVSGSVALRGAVHARTFVATDVYRALPGVDAARGDSFYGAKRMPDGSTEADELNRSRALSFDRVDVSAAAASFVDQTWLAARVLASGALVAGSLDVADDGSLVLRASQVLMRVPEQVSCPAPLFIVCSEGTSAVYERDAERCVVQTGCAAKGVCPLPIPACESGYTRATWTSANGCAAYACDPAFDPAP